MSTIITNERVIVQLGNEEKTFESYLGEGHEVEFGVLKIFRRDGVLMHAFTPGTWISLRYEYDEKTYDPSAHVAAR